MASILDHLGCINNNPTNYCRISVPAIKLLPVTSLLMQSCRRHRSTAQLQALWGLLSCATSSIPCLPFLLSKNSFPCPLGIFETAAGFVSYIQVLSPPEEYVGPPFWREKLHQNWGGKSASNRAGIFGHPMGHLRKLWTKHSYETVSLRVHDRPWPALTGLCEEGNQAISHAHQLGSCLR